MIIQIIAIGFFIGFILLLMGRESKRNDVYNQIKDSNESEDIEINTHY